MRAHSFCDVWGTLSQAAITEIIDSLLKELRRTNKVDWCALKLPSVFTFVEFVHCAAVK